MRSVSKSVITDLGRQAVSLITGIISVIVF